MGRHLVRVFALLGQGKQASFIDFMEMVSLICRSISNLLASARLFTSSVLTSTPLISRLIAAKVVCCDRLVRGRVAAPGLSAPRKLEIPGACCRSRALSLAGHRSRQSPTACHRSPTHCNRQPSSAGETHDQSNCLRIRY